MLYLAEYTDIGSTGRGSVPIPMEPAVATQVLDVTAGSVQSAAFHPSTCLVSLVADEDCMIAVGKDPSRGQTKLMAGIEKLISIPAGADFKVAVTAADSTTKTGNMDSLGALVKLLASPSDAQKQYAIMQANADKMAAAAADLRKASEENAAIRDQLIEATNSALKAKADADRAAGDLTGRENNLGLDCKEHAEKVRTDSEALAQRAKALDEGASILADKQAALNKLGSDVADRAGNLDAREKDLIAREAAAVALQSDYEARIARFKALTA